MLNFLSIFGGIEAPEYLGSFSELSFDTIYDVIIEQVCLFCNLIAWGMHVARISRGWVRPGVDPRFLVGGRWRGQRPRARREVPRGWNEKLVHFFLF